jgi:hypothetical protein
MGLLKLHHNREAEKGQALVEFALAISLLLLLIIGMMEFGLVFHTYLSLDHASLEGARVGALGGSDEAIVDKVHEVVAGDVELEYLQVKITPQSGQRRRSHPLSVTVEYPADFLTPVFDWVLGSGKLHLKAKAVMRIE